MYKFAKDFRAKQPEDEKVNVYGIIHETKPAASDHGGEDCPCDDKN